MLHPAANCLLDLVSRFWRRCHFDSYQCPTHALQANREDGGDQRWAKKSPRHQSHQGRPVRVIQALWTSRRGQAALTEKVEGQKERGNQEENHQGEEQEKTTQEKAGRSGGGRGGGGK
jgi:hypothetical protein